MNYRILAVILTILVVPAQADPIPAFMAQLPIICTEQTLIDNKLRKEHKEAPILRGYVETGDVMQFYKSEDGKWTVTMLRPDGNECLIMNGEKLQEVPWMPGEKI